MTENSLQSPSDDDFSALLVKAERDAEEESLATQTIEAIHSSINTGLLAHNVPSLLTSEGTSRSEVIAETSRELEEYLRASLPEANEEEIDALTLEYLSQECAKHHSILFDVAYLCATEHEYGSGLAAEQYKARQKGQLIASCVVDRHIPLESSWVPFLNDIAPGKQLTDDELSQAIRSYIDQNSARQNSQLNQEFAITLAADAAKLTEAIAEAPTLEPLLLNLVAAAPYLAEHELDAKTHELARTTGLPAVQIASYIATCRQNLSL